MIRAHLAALTVTLIYGLFYVALKHLVTEMSLWDTFILRLLLATPLLFVLERIFFNVRIESRRDLVHILGLGLLGIILVQATIVVGVANTTVFHTGFLVGMAPIITLLLSILMKQERFNGPKGVGMAIAFIGLVLLLFSRVGQEYLPPTYLFGDFMVFLNITAWSLFLILSRPILKKYPAFTVTSYAFLLSALVTLPFLLTGAGYVPGGNLSGEGWLWMSFVVLFATVFTYSLSYYALSYLMPSIVATYIYLQPLVTALFAHWILGEVITPLMIIEGLVILVGVIIATESYRTLIHWWRIRRAG